MKNVKAEIELFFEKWTRVFYRHPLITLLVLLTITGSLLVEMRHLTFDTSSESLLHKNDPHRLEYDRFRQMFGQDRSIILAVSSKNIFKEDFLKKLKALEREIETTVPYLKKVDSLITARSISGKNGTLHVGELLESWPKQPMDMKMLRRRVMSNPFYLNHFISEDGTMTALVIETEAVIVDEPISESDILAGFSDNPEAAEGQAASGSHFITAKEIREIVADIERIIPRYQAENFDIGLTGSPVVVDVFNRAVAEDMSRCSLLAISVIALLMGLLFRRLSGVCIPLFVVVTSVISTLGIMAMLRVDIKIMTAILPVFILCVGVADSVHILSAFFREYHSGISKEDAIARAMKNAALAVLMTSLTTAAGLLSFAFAEISAIGEMGIFSAIGVVFALGFTLCMIPPLLALIPLKPVIRKDRSPRLMNRILNGTALLSADHAKKVVFFSALLFVLSAAYLPKLHYVDHMLNYFPDHMKVKHDIIRIDKGLSGIITFEAVIDSGKENGLHDPVLLKRIDAFSRRLQNDPATPGIRKVVSIADIVKEINQALHDDDPSYYTIPNDRRLIAQELLLFENSGSEELEPIVDTGFSKTRVSIKVPWLDSMGLYRLGNQIGRLLEEMFDGYAGVSLTGMSFILARTLPATLTSMRESYVLAAVVISILMIFLAGDMKTGLIAMFPNLLPIMLIMGGLAVLEIPLDMTSLMIGSIAIGLVVDDTMHFIHHFRRHFNQNGDARESVRLTLLGAGRAMLITSLVLAGGFLTLTVAELPNLSRFGILLAITLMLALMADFILAPALMVLTAKHCSRNAGGTLVPIPFPAGIRNQKTVTQSALFENKSVKTKHQSSSKGESRHAV